MRGEYMESCNCDYLCPCIYTNPQAPVTYDHCTAALVFRIDAGNYGEIRLDGLKFALMIRSGKVMADGNWIFAGVVDEARTRRSVERSPRSSAAQAGGPPAFIRENLVSDFRGIDFKPIEFGLDGLNRSAAIPDVLSSRSKGCVTQPQRRAVLHRQHGASGGAAPRLGARQGDAYAWLWPRARSRRQGQ